DSFAGMFVPRPEPCAERVLRRDGRYRLYCMRDDLAGAQAAGAEQESVAKGLRSLADCGVHFAVFVAHRSFRNQANRDRRPPVLIYSVSKSARIGAPVMCCEVMRESAILQVGLIAGDAHPIAGMAE